MGLRRRVAGCCCALLAVALVVSAFVILGGGGPAASPETAVHPAYHGKDNGVPVAAPSKGSRAHPKPVNNTHGKTHGTPVVKPQKRTHRHHSPATNTYVKGPAASPTKSPIIHRKGHGIPVAAPPKEHSTPLPPTNWRHHKGRHNTTELAQDIASGVSMNQSQVRVMGANAAPEDPGKTVVLIDLVPMGEKFDNSTALLVFERFWHKQIIINHAHFGNYDVLYVQYPVPLLLLVLCSFVMTDMVLFTHAGPGSVVVGSRIGSRPISASPSFSSGMVTYKGSAKTFSLAEMERATQGFDESRIIGEGGFGRVYEGILEDGERVAVKILKRDDQQGSDKGTARLDWDARLKIALGAARALAYLHEDSSPRVIHRDFKSSNILLEYDFTPKVSDFGLARTALGEGNEHISTRVMGTFGYVAPEYAMTGHLLVKSDVYSYGVVLLELLTGRKPVDMSRPPGQENLVAWASSLLTSRDGLEALIDPSLGSSVPFDSIAKVAAIASMCVQPEVDQRPFMGEVVQALKLVCNEGSEFNESRSFSQDLHIQDAEIIGTMSPDMDVDSAELFTSSARYDAMDDSGSFRRYTSSGPLRTGRTGHGKDRGLSTGSSSEHVGLQRYRTDSE
ncbi:hypothetical protein PR202_ga09926 [Eleusine coracana subsp. coracana]|uniref:Protein kinase domain-containing protein n=1 Tax=Eleusine coracana subsp. coracana TaxID=191504 RepID=A0AAV5C4Z5_ELECO|nr:hypothetical protein PR202_ga09926 [Eleusine coracana subsp. coracana]